MVGFLNLQLLLAYLLQQAFQDYHSDSCGNKAQNPYDYSREWLLQELKLQHRVIHLQDFCCKYHRVFWLPAYEGLHPTSLQILLVEQDQH